MRKLTQEKLQQGTACRCTTDLTDRSLCWCVHTGNATSLVAWPTGQRKVAYSNMWHDQNWAWSGSTASCRRF